MKERKDTMFLVGILVLFVALILIVAYEINDMLIDHNCYIDGHYDTPQCQKYIREGE